MLINNDKRLIALGGTIKVPAITREDFARLFREYIEKHQTHHYRVTDPVMFEQILLTNKGKLNMDSDFFEYMPEVNPITMNYVRIDALPDEILGDALNIVGLRQTNKGIPFLGCLMEDDEGLPVFRVVYYDGTQFKIYTPYYGNCWNILCTEVIDAEVRDERETNDYCMKFGTTFSTVMKAPRKELIDEKAIMEELDIVFV